MPAHRAYTANQIRKAGKLLRTWWHESESTGLLITPDVGAALDLLDAYRAEHQAPLTKATMALRSMVHTVEGHGSVSQRLKRHFSIVRKLAREPAM